MNIGFREDLTHEFKSDRDCLSNDVIIEACVVMANTEGGSFYLGIENNGDITGLHEKHRKDNSGLPAYIANKTVPPIAVSVELVCNCDHQYIRIDIPRSISIVATTSGKILRRRLKSNGDPEDVPMYVHELSTRLSSLRLLDYSALAVPEASENDLDASERDKIRNIIRNNQHGEKILLDLDDEEFDRALRFVTLSGDKYVPTFCGMIMIGRSDRLKELVPTAEAAFQVQSGTNIVLNESFILPLVTAFEKMEMYMNARNSEVELEFGLLRSSVPDYDKRAFREALVNAFCHRDYTILGRVRVQLDDDGLTITNPGGFIEGISVENLLSAEPQGRNPALADALKRIGLAERTGRGIDRIYEGSLIYGKPIPDYSESTINMVKLFIPKGLPDKEFVEFISDEQNKSGRMMPINSLLVLNKLRETRRANFTDLYQELHINESKLKVTLEQLIEAGLIEAVGSGKSRNYMLSAKIYKKADKTAQYVRQSGIDAVRYPEMIIKYANTNGKRITRSQAAELLSVDSNKAYRILSKMVKEGRLRMIGSTRNAFYEVI